MEPKRRGRKPKAVELDAALSAEIAEIAQEILRERKADARRVAAQEVTNRLLEQILALQSVVSNGKTSLVQPPAPAAPSNPCVICGRNGSWKNPRGGGWHCRAHAAQVIADNKEDALGSSLAGALKTAVPVPHA